jgi:hypothetical protein
MRARNPLFGIVSPFSLLLALLLALAVEPAGAASFEVISQERFVLLEDLVAQTTTRLDAPDAGPFDATLTAPHAGSLAQLSTLGATRIRAELSHDLITAGPGGEWLQGESALLVAFDLDEASAYALDVSVLRTVPFGDPGGNSLPADLQYHAVMSVLLTGPGGTLFEWSFDDHVDCTDTVTWACPPPDESFAQSGTLAAGSYALELRSLGEVQGFTLCSPSLPGCVGLFTDSDGSVTFDLQLVPEPGTGLLLAFGVAGLAAGGRSTRRGARGSRD